MLESIDDIRRTFGDGEEYMPHHHSVWSKETLHTGGSEVPPAHKHLTGRQVAPVDIVVVLPQFGQTLDHRVLC